MVEAQKIWSRWGLYSDLGELRKSIWSTQNKRSTKTFLKVCPSPQENPLASFLGFYIKKNQPFMPSHIWFLRENGETKFFLVDLFHRINDMADFEGFI